MFLSVTRALHHHPPNIMNSKTPSFSQDLVLLNDLLEESPPEGAAVTAAVSPRTPKTPSSPAPIDVEDEDVNSAMKCESPTHTRLLQVSDYLKSFDIDR
jgi:hypothetical protein